MDDLSSLDWTVRPTANGAGSSPASLTTSFRPSPVPSRSSTPQQSLGIPSSLSNGSRSATKSPSPSTDSFAGLVPSSSAASKSSATVSLQEQQKRLVEEKRRQQAEQARMWDVLGGGSGQPGTGSGAIAGTAARGDEDILAAFNSAAPVDRSTHFPPPPESNPASGRSTPQIQPAAPVAQTATMSLDDDDDPFGLGALAKKTPSAAAPATQSPLTATVYDDDDILGDLGKPVSSQPAKVQQQQPPSAQPSSNGTGKLPRASSKPSDPLDRSIAELVDMGFPADKARQSLLQTDGNVQSAVSWLLNQAHQDSKLSKQSKPPPPPRETRPERASSRTRDTSPAWMNQAFSAAGGQEKDVAKYATELGTSLFKSANSLWKSGQKKVHKAMTEFQAEGDPEVPKWMRDAGSDVRRQPARSTVDKTDEAMMLESGASRNGWVASPTKTAQRQALPPRPGEKRPPTRLTRQEVEEQATQVYQSPARRKRPADAQPAPSQSAPPPASAEPEVDLFNAPPVVPVAAPTPKGSLPTTQAPAPAAPAPRPVASRAIPSLSSIALASSAEHRKAGTEAYKRGDYDAAHVSYSAAMTPLPPTHPALIVVLCNHALTSIKTGDAKTAVTDADAAMAIIGPGRGEGETIDLGDGEAKDMKEFYGKALTRKAEALEHMEKWADAARVWRDAVAAGVGGSVSLQARARCEKAAGGSAERAPVPFRAASAPARAKLPVRPAAASTTTAKPVVVDDTASRKLRETHAAQERAEDEKFALHDQVEARLAAWKGGKADNLRALLASLDSVLWDEVGWKKVGMGDLIVPGKVKVCYIKAIAKVHPDKIAPSATTEQKMISAAVFGTLNEAWDKFRADNGL